MADPWPAWRNVLSQFLRGEWAEAKKKGYTAVLEGNETDPQALGRAREGLAIFRQIESRLSRPERSEDGT